MDDIFTFVVEGDEFDKILSGKKKIQLVIDDKKHRVYEVGNQIAFQKKLDENETEPAEQKAEIENLLYFANVNEAVETLGKEECGYKSGAPIEKVSDIFLAGESYENVEKNGIVAILFKLV